MGGLWLGLWGTVRVRVRARVRVGVWGTITIQHSYSYYAARAIIRTVGLGRAY